MKPEWRRYAPVGLLVSLLAAVATAVFYFLYREFNLLVQISLALTILGLAVFAFLDPDRVRISLTGRQARYGSNALVLTLAFVGILVVINYFVYQNSKRWDLTQDKTFTLSTETLDALKSLPEPVKATGFFSAQVSSTTAKELLDQYKFNSDGKFTYEFVDPYNNPVAAETAKITRDGTIVLALGANQELITTVSEQEITNGLVRLMNPERRKIYFLTGHGERSLDQSDQQGLSQIKRSLEGKNYLVESLNLLASNTIPDDAKVIVVAGPVKPVSAGEVDLLGQWVAKGGSLIIAEEPPVMTQFGTDPDPLADYLAQTWGILLGNDFVIDQSSNQPSVAIGANWGSHAIVQKLTGMVAVMPSARSISIQKVDGVTQANLVSTFSQAWGETDVEALKGQGSVAPDAGVDAIGPLTLAVAAESLNGTGKVVVFGDVDFVSDGFFTAYANSDLFINSVDWSAGKADLISLTPKDSTSRTMIAPQKLTLNLLLLGLVIVLPGVPLILGIVIWIQRRRRG
jgi:ABC-type uncharacterized transport system involved in gliding motility auxiliary subunit